MEIVSTKIISTAQSYLENGFSVIPVLADGTKRPALDRWKPYQTQRVDTETLEEWFEQGRNGIGIVCGPVSNNLIVLDFECPTVFDAWKSQITERKP